MPRMYPGWILIAKAARLLYFTLQDPEADPRLVSARWNALLVQIEARTHEELPLAHRYAILRAVIQVACMHTCEWDQRITAFVFAHAFHPDEVFNLLGEQAPYDWKVEDCRYCLESHQTVYSQLRYEEMEEAYERRAEEREQIVARSLCARFN